MKKVWYIVSAVLLVALASCQSDTPSMIELGLDDSYVVPRMKSLPLHPEFTGERYEWRLSCESAAGAVSDSLVATTRDYTFVAGEEDYKDVLIKLPDLFNHLVAAHGGHEEVQ